MLYICVLTAQMNVAGSTPPSIKGGKLPKTYNVGQFHFHWGNNNNKGSEHTVNSKEYPLEVSVIMDIWTIFYWSLKPGNNFLGI